MKKSSRVVSTLLLGATVASASTGVFAVESKEIIKEKLAGETRFETAVEVSNKFGKADTVVLVNYTGIADALAATPLAKMKNAPILLTEAGSLTKATADQIAKLEAKKVIVIGGETAVSKNVVKQLEELKLDVERVAGEDRYATSEAVANEMGKDGKVEKVAVVNGIKGLADALSVAAPAAKEGMAIVLSDGTSVRAGQKVLDEAKTKYVIGGETVVSKELTEKLGAERLAGANRNATNAEVLNKFYDAKELDKVYVAKDGAAKENQLVDALAAGPLAGKEGNPLVLAGSELDKAQEAYLKDRIAKSLVEVGEGINQNTVSAIVKALTVKEETPSDKAEVTGVSILNANQVEFKFSEAVDKDSAEKLENYEVKKDGKSEDLLKTENYLKELGKENAIAKAGKAEVQADGKTVILTLPQAYLAENAKFFNQETIRVKVENIMTENKNEVFEKYENKKVKLFDNTLPELKEVNQVGPKEFDLVFTEPVTADGASTIASAIRIDGGKYTCTAKTRIDNDVEAKKINSNVVRIKTGSEVAEGEHTLTIKENKLMDYAGLKLEAVDTKFEAKKAENDLTASVYKTSGQTITLDFNREVENAETVGNDANSNVSYYLDYKNDKGYKAEKAEMVDGKLELTFNRDIPSGEHKVLVVYGNEKKDKVQDLWENELASKEISFTVAKDTVAPTAAVTYNKSDKKIEIKYSKLVRDKEATTASNYTLKDEQGNFKNISSVDKKEGNSLVYTIDAENLSGKYTLTIKNDKIHDTSVEKNAVKECSFELDTLDSLAPSVTSVRYGGDKDLNKIYVEFSEDMKTEGEGSITDKSLYHVNYKSDVLENKEENKYKDVNKTLDDIEDAKIEAVGDNAVIITLEDNINKENSALKVKIGRVCDANGNFVNLDGFENNKIMNHVNSGEFGNEFEAISDSTVRILSAKELDDDNILEASKDEHDNTIYPNVNIVDSKKIEVYVQGDVTSVVADSIKLDGNQCTEVKSQSVNLKVDEGQYVKATKLTLKFKNEINSETINKLQLEAEAITTNLDTKSQAYVLNEDKDSRITLTVGKESSKKVVKYVDDSATMFVKDEGDKKNIADKVVIRLTTPVHNVTVDTFKIDNGSYKVKSVGYGEDNSVVILTLDGKSSCNAEDGDASLDVELANPIYDINNNRTDEMDTFQIERVVKTAEFDAVNGADKTTMRAKLEAIGIKLPKGMEDVVAEKVAEIKGTKKFQTMADIDEAVAKATKEAEAEAEADKTAKAEADKFKEDYAVALALKIDTVKAENKTDVEKAKTALGKLSAEAQEKLTAEKTLLDNLLKQIADLEAVKGAKDELNTLVVSGDLKIATPTAHTNGAQYVLVLTGVDESLAKLEDGTIAIIKPIDADKTFDVTVKVTKGGVSDAKTFTVKVPVTGDVTVTPVV
ncbi:cell wall-binding repeat-containing protein [Clostridium senegalense]|uniref:cell wall-binding repeat-containing protein n=1 Tax=Clostridium senegalense TaxID=1465809 RepID=UPI001C1087F8|nr:cell wall-binding repeat-containing protein [Clostridium senegalense]MBU5228067.1 cell wall-binding repeat-containing protein [Clostridium senegalense]